jgi:hypothetical protein
VSNGERIGSGLAGFGGGGDGAWREGSLSTAAAAAEEESKESLQSFVLSKIHVNPKPQTLNPKPYTLNPPVLRLEQDPRLWVEAVEGRGFGLQQLTTRRRHVCVCVCVCT